jgi:galactokinase
VPKTARLGFVSSAELREAAESGFRRRFGADPAAIGLAPGRVNLIGEHVDYAGGLVLPAAIDRFVAVACTEGQDWQAVSDDGDALPYLHALAGELGRGPLRAWVAADLPIGAGVSSSAALLVAAAAALEPHLDGREAALLCQRAEQSATGVMVGVMDQFAAALGRAGFAILLDCTTLETRYLPFPDDILIAVVDSGIRRRLADTPYNLRRQEFEAGMPRRRRHVETEIQRVREFAAALEAGRRDRLGPLLVASHGSLRDDYEVSTPEVDALVERAIALPGCLGSRIMGAGFGGSVLALVEAGREAEFVAGIGAPTLICHTADGAFV